MSLTRLRNAVVDRIVATTDLEESQIYQDFAEENARYPFATIAVVQQGDDIQYGSEVARHNVIITIVNFNNASRLEDCLTLADAIRDGFQLFAGPLGAEAEQIEVIESRILNSVPNTDSDNRATMVATDIQIKYKVLPTP